jgi:hypothetical protein
VVGRRAAAAADEDEGPWSRPLPLGVYRIGVGVGNVRESGVAANDDDQDAVGESLSFAGQLPLHDAPDDESNVIDFLFPGQCVEVVETRVLVVKKKRKRAKDGCGRHGATGTANRPPSGGDAAGEQVVRARCMVPVITPPNNSVGGFGGGKPQRTFRFGWITLVGGGASGSDYSSVAAFPIPLGAYVVTAEDPPGNGDAANSKAKFAFGSVSDNSSL